MRSGQRLQWLNIAREIAARSLSFRKEEVHTIITQAVWQVGHLTEHGERESHIELSDPSFCFVLLKEMEIFLRSIEASWLEGVSARTIIALTNRILVSTTDSHVKDHARSLLENARNVTFLWTRQLAKKLQENEDETRGQELQLRVCEMAATCRMTYDVDREVLRELLVSDQDIAVLVECAILIHHNAPANMADSTLDFRRLLARDRRLSLALEPLLLAKIHESAQGFNTAMSAIWESFHSNSDWHQLSRPNDRWIETNTVLTIGQESQRVQLNVLEGQLLIDGKPLGRLPSNIMSHPTYIRIFGKVRYITLFTS